jgi:hypothetical protein
MIYKLEAAEKISTNNEVISGGTILSKEFKTEREAKKQGEAWLKKSNVLSVWIYKIEEEECDPLYQWKRYEDDKDWKGGNYWS